MQESPNSLLLTVSTSKILMFQIPISQHTFLIFCVCKCAMLIEHSFVLMSVRTKRSLSRLHLLSNIRLAMSIFVKLKTVALETNLKK